MSAVRRVLLKGVLAFGVMGLSVVNPALAQEELTDWARVEKAGVLKVAVYNYLTPYSHEGKGIDVDIATLLAAKLGLKVQIRAFNEGEEFTDDLRAMVVRGHYLAGPPADILMHAPIDDYVMKKETQVLFFNPYVRDDIYIARNIKELPDLTSLEPFATPGRKIGAEVASLSSVVLAGGDSGAYVNNLNNFKTPQEAVAELVKGNLVAVMATRAELEAALRGVPNRDQFYVARIPHTLLPPKGWVAGMATRKDNIELARRLTVAMDELRASGEIEKVFARYGVTYMKP